MLLVVTRIQHRRSAQRGRTRVRRPKARSSPAPERKAGAMSAIAAGIIGGVITLLGAGGLQFAGLLPSPGATVTAPAGDEEALAALKAELAALKQDVDAVKANPGGDTDEAIAIGRRPQLRRPGRVVGA